MLDVGCFSFQQIRPFQRRQKILLHVGKLFPGDGIARDQNQLHRPGEFMLVQPETFAQQPPRAASFHRAADFPAGDDAEPGLAAVRQFVPIGNQATLRETLALLPDAREIAVLREPRGAAQAFRRFGGHAREIKPA